MGVGIARWLVVTALLGGCKLDSAVTDAATDIADPVLDSGGEGADVPRRPCDLLARAGCTGGTSCYPFPFNEMPTGEETRCGTYQPLDEPAPQCDSHLQCPGGSVCATLFAIDTVCHRLCDVNLDACGQGMACIPLPGYEPAGLCL